MAPITPYKKAAPDPKYTAFWAARRRDWNLGLLAIPLLIPILFGIAFLTYQFHWSELGVFAAFIVYMSILSLWSWRGHPCPRCGNNYVVWRMIHDCEYCRLPKYADHDPNLDGGKTTEGYVFLDSRYVTTWKRLTIAEDVFRSSLSIFAVALIIYLIGLWGPRLIGLETFALVELLALLTSVGCCIFISRIRCPRCQERFCGDGFPLRRALIRSEECPHCNLQRGDPFDPNLTTTTAPARA